MAGRNDRDRDRKRSPKDTGRRTKKKVCQFCRDRTDWVDYKDVPVLRKFMSDRGKIRNRRVSGNCVQHQRDVAIAIKTARELALLPYAQRTLSERGAGRGRGGGGGRGRDGDRRDAPRRDDLAAVAEGDVLTETGDALDTLLEGEVLEAGGTDDVLADVDGDEGGDE
jgi:small subunit ribosomal protein S18